MKVDKFDSSHWAIRVNKEYLVAFAFTVVPIEVDDIDEIRQQRGKREQRPRGGSKWRARGSELLF
jgi:hypothetical protein